MLNRYDKKIPQFTEKDYDVIEFSKNLHPKILIKPMYYELEFSSRSEIFGRKVVLDRLMTAVKLLPANYGLLIWDVYRPRSVQATLFEWMRSTLSQKFPNLSQEELYNETKKYIAEASTVGDSYCAPHLSGGAIDLTLYDIEKGEAFDMGTPFDDCSELAHSDYYDKYDPSTATEIAIKFRRQLLRTIMNTQGFTTYYYEWWHYDIGNILWSRKTNSPQAFGPLFADHEWND